MTDSNQEKPRTDFLGAREGIPTGETVKLTDEQQAARKKRNVAIAIGLVAFMAIIMIVTVLRISQNIASGAAG